MMQYQCPQCKTVHETDDGAFYVMAPPVQCSKCGCKFNAVATKKKDKESQHD